jgi:hypothetical protein
VTFTDAIMANNDRTGCRLRRREWNDDLWVGWDAARRYWYWETTSGVRRPWQPPPENIIADDWEVEH